MPSPFEDALWAAVALCHTLPQDRAKLDDAKTRFAAFQRNHPETPSRILVDCPPGQSRIECDILLSHPDGGTVGVTFRSDDGVPWLVEYSDHWAANYVVTVNNRSVTIQEALLFLKMASNNESDLMNRLVEERLLASCLEDDPPSVSQKEVQQAADVYRAANGLRTAESIRRLFDEWGITAERFRQMLVDAVGRRKVRERVTEGQVDAFFQANRDEFARVRVLSATFAVPALADRVAREARETTLAAALSALDRDPEADGVEALLASRPARDLPAELSAAGNGAVVGPIPSGARWLVAQVLAKQAASLDEATRRAVREILFRRWLEQQREGAAVEWHWL